MPSPAERSRQAESLAGTQSWQRLQIVAESFVLLSFASPRRADDAGLTVYIEGDGLAWRSPDQPSRDPTPVTALALQLALAQPTGNVAYLGRPCQYLGSEAAAQACGERYWTGARFAPEVVEAADRAVDVLAARFGARRITLVGYSGGGTVAALLAARRRDVARLITVAGNLDPRAWTRMHRLQPLAGSLDPADVRAELAGVPQWHLVGGRDLVMPPRLAQDFAAGFAPAQRPAVVVVADYDHACCWARDWPRLWRAIAAPAAAGAGAAVAPDALPPSR